jgi:hypothetical protein
MKVGDLVKLEQEENMLVINDMKDERRGAVGSVQGFDAFFTSSQPTVCVRTLVDVIWSTGSREWIPQDRVELVAQVQ